MDQEEKEETSAVHVWLILWKSYEAVHAYAMEQIGSLDMCMSDFAVLEILLHKGSLPINEIGKRLALTSGSMTTAIDRLEQRGLARREANADDRRTRYVTLTASGRKLIARAFGEHSAWLEQAGSALSLKERKTLISLLKKFGFSAQAKLTEQRAKRDLDR
jgi:MarR family transcriptional regulator, 2-MHQ and catechol-resistance regulon repressor